MIETAGGSDTTRVPVSAAIAVAAPPAAACAVALLLLAGWAVGWHPFWPTPDVTLSEAAAVRDDAEVVRLIEQGHDPSRRWAVRSGIIDGDGHLLTPLEAAVMIRRLQTVELLLREGAVLTAEQRNALIELADAHSAPDIAEYLRTHALVRTE